MGDIRRAIWEHEPTDDEQRTIEERYKQRRLAEAEYFDLLKYQEYDCTPFGDVPLLSKEELCLKRDKANEANT